MTKYANRNPRLLEPYFSQHMDAMTAESLLDKADIAAELAYRDQEIAKVHQWMLANGFATGYGDTVEELLKELSWQIEELRAKPQAMTTNIPYTERDLIQRAIQAARPPAHKSPMPRWALVKQTFLTGQTVSKLICSCYGFDPDKEISADTMLFEE